MQPVSMMQGLTKCEPAHRLLIGTPALHRVSCLPQYLNYMPGTDGKLYYSAVLGEE